MRSRRLATGLAICAALAATGCGTRVKTGSTVSAPVQTTTAVEQATPALPSDEATGRVPTASGLPSPQKQPGSPPAQQQPGRAAVTTETSAGAKTTPSTKPAPAGSAVPGQPPTGSVVPQKKSPAVVGSVGSYSGPLGSAFKPPVDGVQAWAKWVNDRGGVNGHQVRLLIYDDGADPARHKALVQQAVERDNVIAFVQNGEGWVGPVSQEYTTQKRVPVIGSDTGSTWFYDSPMYFPQATTGDALIGQYAVFGAAQQALPDSKKKMGILVCAENPHEACRTLTRVATNTAPKAGFELVYSGTASITQPDFTAECLSASRAGVQVLFLSFDTNTVRRIAASCARQGFRPAFTPFSAVITADDMKNDPNLDGLIASSAVFPWFASGTPAIDEYRQVMKTFNIPAGAGPAVGWVTAKLFEKAAANLSEPPTRDSLLRGLWSIKNDTLGGLTGPLTFTEGQNAPKTLCWFPAGIENKAWVGQALQCRPYDESLK